MNGGNEYPALPALRSLGRLADVRPVVIIDTREQAPLVFERLPSRRGTLSTGDYSFSGGERVLVVERKSIADLVACVTGERERFERELERLRGFPFARLLVVGSVAEIERHEYRSAVSPSAVLHSLHAWEARFVPVVFASCPREAARLVERWAYWNALAIVERANALLRGSNETATEEELCKT